jgi:tRNA(fMet)-specific endonuclease VapC
VRAAFNEIESALSAASIVEFTHGISRAKLDKDRDRRTVFTSEICRDMIIHPMTREIAQLAGRIEGEQANRGNVIAFQDLVIGSTALFLGFDVLTLNVRHFQRIPSLRVLTL